MSNDTSMVRQNSLWKKIFKYFLLTALSLLIVLTAAHFIWKASGSNQWELALEKNGVKVYTLKSPGTVWRKFKATAHIKTTLSNAVAAMKDTDIESCRAWIHGCATSQSVEAWDPQKLSFVQFYHVAVPFPLSPREFLLKTQFARDPGNQAVTAEFTAVPDELPRNSCCIRVSHVHNRWSFTPLTDDEVEVELVQDLDAGGFFPYFVYNRRMPQGLYVLFSRLPKLLNKEKFQNAKLDF